MPSRIAPTVSLIASHIPMKKFRNASLLFQSVINAATSRPIAVIIRPIGFAASTALNSWNATTTDLIIFATFSARSPTPIAFKTASTVDL